MDALIKRDGDRCTLCHREFRHKVATFYGVANNAPAVVGECCVTRLQTLWGGGIYLMNFDRAIEEIAADTAKRAGVPQVGLPTLCDTAWKSDDREWFKANPARSHRLRPCFPQEMPLPAPAPPPPQHEFQILVRQVEPGRRVRMLFCRNVAVDIPDIEPLLHALFDLAQLRDGDNRRVGEVISVREVAALAMKYAEART